MRHVPKADLLEALKQSLRDLDNLKILSPDDIEIRNLRRALGEQIEVLERQQSQRQVRKTTQNSDDDVAA